MSALGVPTLPVNTLPVSALSVVLQSRLAHIVPEATLVAAAQLLGGVHITMLVVCQGAAGERGGCTGPLLGVLSASHIVRQFALGSDRAFATRVADVMSAPTLVCQPDEQLHSVLARMRQHGAVQIPVLDAQSRPLGVLTARDALRALLAADQYEAALLRDYVMGTDHA